jgi:predicted dinucleotide-binding enzyme
MDITIIGTGRMGKAIGTRLAAAGNSITFVGRDADHAKQAVSEVRAAAAGGGRVETATVEEVKLGEVVVLALWYGTNIEVVKRMGSRLAGRIVVDIANPVNSTYDGLVTSPDSSSAEDVARAAAAGVRVVKAFNTTFMGTLLAGKVAGQPLDVFLAGDDADAREKVGRLIQDAGMRPVDCGVLSRARLIEGMQLLHILAQGSLGTNFGSAIKFVG